MKTTSDARNVVLHGLTDEFDPSVSLDPERLIGLLESIDGLKQEVQDRMRRIEAVNKAKSLLQEDALRTEALNRKLAELGRIFGDARHEPLLGEIKNREADLLRMPTRESLAEVPLRHAEPHFHGHDFAESIHLEPQAPLENPFENPLREVAFHAEPAFIQPAAAEPEAVDIWALDLKAPVGGAEASPVAVEPQLTFVQPIFPVFSTDPHVAERVFPEEVTAKDPIPGLSNSGSQAAAALELFQFKVEPAQEPAVSTFLIQESTFAAGQEIESFADSASIDIALSLELEPAPDTSLFAQHAAAEDFASGTGVDESPVEGTADEPVEMMPSLVRESYRDVAQRFTEAAIQQSERLPITESTPDRERVGDETRALPPGAQIQPRSVDVSSNLAEFNRHRESVSQQLEEARQTWSQALEALVSARLVLEQSSAQMNLSRTREETASTDLKSAQQDLTTAYQFASVAAQRHHDAVEFFQKSNRWMIAATAISWAIMTWISWLQFHKTIPVWAPAAATAVIAVLAVVINRWGSVRE